MARLGESLAALFLEERGGKIVARNVRSGRGEIDLIVRFPDGLVAVEVKTRTGGDPRDAFTRRKADHVWQAVGGLKPKPRRVDLVAVSLTRAGVGILWIPGVS